MRYRFKGIVRTTGQTVEGHAHGEAPDVALQALSDHGIVTESLREDPEPLNMAGQAQPLSSAIDSALDTAASQIPFDKIADRYKGKNVWVLDRDKIRTRVAQVVDQAIAEATNGMSMAGAGGLDVSDLRKQVSEAIGGLFKDNRNLTSQVTDTSMKMEHQLRRLEQMVHRQESLLAQMTIAIGRIGSGGGGGGGWGPRRFAGQGAGGGEQNAVLLEIFKENLRLRGIEIDEQASAAANTDSGGASSEPSTVSAPPIDMGGGGAGGPNGEVGAGDRPQRPALPPGASETE